MCDHSTDLKWADQWHENTLVNKELMTLKGLGRTENRIKPLVIQNIYFTRAPTFPQRSSYTYSVYWMTFLLFPLPVDQIQRNNNNMTFHEQLGTLTRVDS